MNEFLMVLTKLQLTFLNEDHSYQFGVSVSAVSIKNILQVVGRHVQT